MGCCVVMRMVRLPEEDKVRRREEGSSMIDDIHDQEAAGEDQDYCTWEEVEEEEEVLHTDDPVVMARIAWVGNAAVQTEDNRDHHECFGPSNHQPILDRIAFGKSRLLRVARRPLTKVVTMMMTPFWRGRSG